ncbi:hypothetical protein ACFOS3_05480 [Paractinoplanes deccanensis]|uniref:hypothetical protein n=1 Tax=Paractinoplanes deccanensis TaxID=113561 RepID=UPI00194430EB|nr:hypothetical protein [Actinoplanes deccanensis]
MRGVAEARAVDIEIVERRRQAGDDSLGASITVPNEVRINGRSVLVADEPIVIDDLSSRSTVRVTLTLIARRVLIDQEHAVGEGVPS